jgi:hypothetical protein
MRISAALLLFVLVGCSPSKLEMKRIPFDGKTWIAANEEQILTKLQKDDNLEGKRKSWIDPSAEVVIAKNGDQYLLRSGGVVATFRFPTPKTGETSIAFWRSRFETHSFLDQALADGTHRILLSETVESPIPSGPSNQAPASKSAHGAGLAVVYRAPSGTVVRVIQYDAQ